MRNLVLFLCFFSFVLHANDHKVPSTIKGVTIYLSGAQITRTASCQLQEGTNEIVFTGLSTKIDESSIQVSGLTSVSIHSISFDINFLKKWKAILKYNNGKMTSKAWNTKSPS